MRTGDTLADHLVLINSVGLHMPLFNFIQLVPAWTRPDQSPDFNLTDLILELALLVIALFRNISLAYICYLWSDNQMAICSRCLFDCLLFTFNLSALH